VWLILCRRQAALPPRIDGVIAAALAFIFGFAVA